MLEGYVTADELDLEGLSFTLASECCYSGSFELAGHTYHMLLGDGNVNGRFDDVATYQPAEEKDPYRALVRDGDRFFLVDTDEIEDRDASVLGGRLSIQGRLFDLDLDMAAGKLILRPFAGDLATVELTTDVDQLSLASEKGDETVMIHRPGSSVKVPPGKYRLSDYRVYREDAQGDRWFLTAEATPRTKVLTLRAGSKTTLNLGEPFVPQATVPLTAYEDFRAKAGSVQVEFSIRGNAGEVVTDLRRVAGNKTEIPLDPTQSFPTEPTFRIVEGTGQIAAQGRFEYG